MARQPQNKPHSLMLVGALVVSLLAPGVVFASPEVASAGAEAQSITLPDHRWIGLYVPGAPGDLAPLAALESKIGRGAVFANYFQSTEQEFTAFQAGNAIDHGAMPLITLELWDHRAQDPVNQPAYSLRAIARGDHDGYLRRYAQQAAAFGKTVWLRPLHEMNGYWYPWGGTVNGNSPSDFVPAWRRIHDIFEQEGADNVRFVWCPNIESIPMTSDNAISRYWPGDAYVDYMALDGYNFGYGDSIVWRSFEDLFDAPYAEVTALSDKPLIVAETGCSSVGGDKAAWITAMFDVIPRRFPRILGVGWFNSIRHRDWRIESSVSSLEAFRTAIRNSEWADRPTILASVPAMDRRDSPSRPGTLTAPPTVGISGSRVRIYFGRASDRAWLLDGASQRPVGRWR